MQFSCKKGIGFLCVPKCGSTSVEKLMRPYSDISLTGNPNLKHARYETLEKFLFPMLEASRVKKPFIFAVVREPISWVESWYRFRGRAELAPSDHPQHHNYSGHLSFPEFVEEVLRKQPLSFARINSQFHYLRDSQGEVGVDQIIPLDNLDTEVPPLLERFGIKAPKRPERKNVSENREAATLPAEHKARLLEHLSIDNQLYNGCFG